MRWVPPGRLALAAQAGKGGYCRWLGSLMGSGEEEVEEEGVPGQDEGVDDQQHLISGATNSKKG